jgi:dihydroorotate dehydrogenase
MLFSIIHPSTQVSKMPPLAAAKFISQPRRPLVPFSSTLLIAIRHASTTSNPHPNRIRTLLYGSALVAVTSLGYIYITDTRSSLHRYVFPPILRAVFPDAEDAHHGTITTLKELYAFGIHPRDRSSPDNDGLLAVEVFGSKILNPIGISGGLDKNGEIPDALLALGPSIVEIGGITPNPQEGNEKPRVFRIPSEQALINRYGLNSDGADIVAMRLRQRVRQFAYTRGLGIGEEGEKTVLNGDAGVPPGSLSKGRLLAVQIAKNKVTPDNNIHAVVKDHVDCVEQLGKYADIIVVNVSSPNTPGLRALQSQVPLTKILSAVVDAAQAIPRKSKPAVMVKVSPDEDSESQVLGICEAVWAAGVDGIIVGNTTKLRPEPLLHGVGIPAREALAMREQGGFSGPHLFERTLRLVRMYRRILDQGPVDEMSGKERQVPKTKTLFASGGITNGTQALEVLNAGASVAMIYTTLVYNGAGTVTRIKNEMRKALDNPKSI